MTEAKCRLCVGTGQLLITCIICFGKGVSFSRWYDKTLYRNDKCHVCIGTGKKFVECLSCIGSYIKDKKTIPNTMINCCPESLLSTQVVVLKKQILELKKQMCELKQKNSAKLEKIKYDHMTQIENIVIHKNNLLYKSKSMLRWTMFYNTQMYPRSIIDTLIIKFIRQNKKHDLYAIIQIYPKICDKLFLQDGREQTGYTMVDDGCPLETLPILFVRRGWIKLLKKISKITDLYVSRPDTYMISPLAAAIKCKQNNIVKFLICACETSLTTDLKILSDTQITPLDYAISYNNNDIIPWFIQKTYLHLKSYNFIPKYMRLAILRNNLNVVKQLILESHLDLHVDFKDFHSVTLNKMNYLEYSIYNKFEPIIDFFIKKGCKIQKTFNLYHFKQIHKIILEACTQLHTNKIQTCHVLPQDLMNVILSYSYPHDIHHASLTLHEE